MPAAKSFRDLLDHMAAANPQDARPRANLEPRPVGLKPGLPKVGLLPGDTYGHLKCIRRDGPSGGQLEWLCACRCGATIRVSGNYLREATDKCQLCGRPAHDHNR
jgi:hypothetical protein